jgi:hypothetical protein
MEQSAPQALKDLQLIRAVATGQGSLQLLTDPAWKVNLEETQMS